MKKNYKIISKSEDDGLITLTLQSECGHKLEVEYFEEDLLRLDLDPIELDLGQWIAPLGGFGL